MNRYPALLLAALTIAMPSTLCAKPQAFAFDTVHSQVLFFASHLGFSHSLGRFPGLSGGFTFDEDDWSASSVDATIAVDTLYMGDADWQKKLLSDDFFDLKRYSTMHFVAAGLHKTGERTATLDGQLTLHGVTKPVQLQVTFNRIGVHSYSFKYVAGFSATTTIKRSDFGMIRLLPAVGDEVEIRLEIEGLRDKKKKEDSTDAAEK